MATFIFSSFSPKFKQLLPPQQIACQAYRSVQNVCKPSDRWMKCALLQSAGNKRENCKKKFVGTMAEMTSRSSSSEEEEVWGEVFKWEIRGAGEEEVWAVTGEFVEVEKWMPNLVKRSERVEGEAQKAGCVRKCVLYPEPCTLVFEKLLSMDEPLHHYTYTIVQGTTAPGFSLLQDYVGTFNLSPLHDPATPKATLLRWGYVCRPVSSLSQEQVHTMLFSLFQAAVDALKPRLSLPDDSITLVAKS